MWIFGKSVASRFGDSVVEVEVGSQRIRNGGIAIIGDGFIDEFCTWEAESELLCNNFRWIKIYLANIIFCWHDSEEA